MMAGHHVRMIQTTPCRCSECSAEFIPDPRVGDRQVTCGVAECQQARHAKQCREWRAANGEATASHYEDVVVPFREQQPDYQRRWRWGQRLREIREKTTRFGGSLLIGLRGLVQRAERLVARTAGVVQTGVLAGEKLDRAVAVVRSTIAAVEQLEASVAELRELGL
jgi:hypothetical protein